MTNHGTSISRIVLAVAAFALILAKPVLAMKPERTSLLQDLLVATNDDVIRDGFELLYCDVSDHAAAFRVLLEAKSPTVRRKAAHSLTSLGQESERAASVLLRELKEFDGSSGYHPDRLNNTLNAGNPRSVVAKVLLEKLDSADNDQARVELLRLLPQASTPAVTAAVKEHLNRPWPNAFGSPNVPFTAYKVLGRIKATQSKSYSGNVGRMIARIDNMLDNQSLAKLDAGDAYFVINTLLNAGPNNRGGYGSRELIEGWNSSHQRLAVELLIATLQTDERPYIKAAALEAMSARHLGARRRKEVTAILAFVAQPDFLFFARLASFGIDVNSEALDAQLFADTVDNATDQFIKSSSPAKSNNTTSDRRTNDSFLGREFALAGMAANPGKRSDETFARFLREVVPVVCANGSPVRFVLSDALKALRDADGVWPETYGVIAELLTTKAVIDDMYVSAKLMHAMDSSPNPPTELVVPLTRFLSVTRSPHVGSMEKKRQTLRAAFAARTLGRIDEEGRSVPKLTELLRRSAESDERSDPIRKPVTIGGSFAGANPEVRTSLLLEVINALGRMGAASTDALPELMLISEAEVPKEKRHHLYAKLESEAIAAAKKAVLAIQK